MRPTCFGVPPIILLERNMNIRTKILEHTNKIIVGIVLFNLASMVLIPMLPIPKGLWAEVYYGGLFFDVFGFNILLSLAAFIMRGWAIGIVSLAFAVFYFLFLASA